MSGSLEAGARWVGESGRAYTLISPLGAGGMGQTWRVRDEADGRELVLKVLRVERADDWKAVELFEREMDVLEGLAIDGVPRFVDRIVDAASGQAAFVQALVPGSPMQALIRASTPVPAARVEAWLRRALGIVAALHAHAPPIIHRDLSPANLLVDPASDDLSVIDLGAVKATLRDATVMTAAGTFGYMAPEQLLGRAEPASDLFGLGMAFTALAARAEPGELPADADGRVDVAAALQHSGLPEHVQRALIAMTEPGLSRRMPDAQAALALLDETPEQRRAREVARAASYRKIVWPLVGAAALVVIGLVPWGWSSRARAGEVMRLGGWFTGHGKPLAAWSLTVLGKPRALGLPSTVEALAFSPDGAALWSMARDEMIVWDLKAGRARCERAVIEGMESGDTLRWSDDAKTLWLAVFNAKLYSYHASSCAPARRVAALDALLKDGLAEEARGSTRATLLRGADGSMQRAVVRAGALRIASADPERPEVLQRLSAAGGSPLALVAATERRALALLTRRSGPIFEVRVWQPDGERLGAPRVLTLPKKTHVNAIALSPDGRTLAVLDQHRVMLVDAVTLSTKTARIFDTGRFTYDFLHETPLVFSPDGSRLAAAIDEGAQLLVLDVASASILKEIPSPAGRLKALAFSPDGKRVASGGEGPSVWLWSL